MFMDYLFTFPNNNLKWREKYTLEIPTARGSLWSSQILNLNLGVYDVIK